MCGDLIEHDGYDYSTVLIGEQCWFSENCRYLPEVSPSSEGNTTDPYYYVYDYEGSDVGAAQATSNYANYGVLYNWPAVMTEGICPTSWHIPSDEEFTQLTDYLGGESVAGDAMKSTSGWLDNQYDGSSGNGSNSSGFNGLPGGYKDVWGWEFRDMYSLVYFWSSYTNPNSEFLEAKYLEMFNSSSGASIHYFHHSVGFSARCVKD